MRHGKLRNAALSLCLLLVTLAGGYGLLTLGVHLFIDDGMQFNLEMWKYARDIKRLSSDPLIGHEHTPGTSSHLMGVDVTINSLGLRDHEISIARMPGTGRILMLGDSFTFGWGVPFDHTLGKRLERMFAGEGRSVEVINAGVGNYNTTMEVQYYLDHGYKFQSDLVVLNYIFNDAEPEPTYHDDGYLARNSELAVVFLGAMDNFLRRSGAESRWDKYYLGLYEKPGWDAAKAAIHRLAIAVRARGAKLIILNWPELHDVGNYRLQHVSDLVQAVADREGIPFIDLLPAVKDQQSSKLWVTAPDPHPNAYANLLFADYVYPKLKAFLPAR
jgi:lysophospholipase L1-like esterase